MRTHGPKVSSLALLIGTMLLIFQVPSASAVPAFARKYATSCQTCHVGFPKLNPFGEAFRLNGYRMPKETEDLIKEKPVSLGADAYKKMWPKAIYPSDLPGNVPLAMNVKFASVYSSSLEDGERAVTKNDFQFPQEVNLFGAGTLGEHMSFFSELTYGEGADGSSETEIEHAQLHFNSVFGPEHLVNFKIGKFAPDLDAGFQEMWISTDNGIDTLFAFNPIGINGGSGLGEDTGISLPGQVKGIEIYGVSNHRFFYTAGIANGLGPSAGDNTDGNANKDVYARVDYKFGGMGLDGDTTGVTLPPENWRERSFRVGVLGYIGNGKGVDFDLEDESGLPVSVQDRRFDRTGIYGSWIYDDLNVFGVYLRGHDRLDTFDEGGVRTNGFSGDYNTWFLQSDYVILPPLQASLRYENLDPADKEAQSLRFLNASLSYFAYANVKTTLEYRRDLRESKNYSLNAILRVAF
jgi:hypothetical protein